MPRQNLNSFLFVLPGTDFQMEIGTRRDGTLWVAIYKAEDELDEYDNLEDAIDCISEEILTPELQSHWTAVNEILMEESHRERDREVDYKIARVLGK